jgi:hypothetical protein
MKITAVRVLRLTGTLRTEAPLWEERLVRPIDIYPEYTPTLRKSGKYPLPTALEAIQLHP